MAELADALGDVVGRAENFGGLFVEEQVQAAEMRPGDMPVKILCLHVERERIRQDRIHRSCDIACGIRAEICRGFQRRDPPRLGILRVPGALGFHERSPCRAWRVAAGPSVTAEIGSRSDGRQATIRCRHHTLTLAVRLPSRYSACAPAATDYAENQSSDSSSASSPSCFLVARRRRPVSPSLRSIRISRRRRAAPSPAFSPARSC